MIVAGFVATSSALNFAICRTSVAVSELATGDGVVELYMVGEVVGVLFDVDSSQYKCVL